MPGAPIVLLQADCPAAGVLFFKVQNIFNGGAAKLIDALVVVPHHTDIAPAPRQRGSQNVLKIVRILVFVDQHIPKLPLIVRKHIGILPEKPGGIIKQVVKIHSARREKPLGIRLVDLRDLTQARISGAAVSGLEVRRRQLVVPGRVQLVQHGFGRVYLVVKIHSADNVLHHRQPVRGIINGEILRVPQLVRVPPQYPHTGGMEGPRPNVVGAVPKHGLQSVFQLVRSFVRKRNSNDPPWLNFIQRGQRPGFVGRPRLKNLQITLRSVRRHFLRIRGTPVPQQVGDAVYQHRCFAAARPRQDEKRPLRRHDSLPLHGIKTLKISLNDLFARLNISFFKFFRHNLVF